MNMIHLLLTCLGSFGGEHDPRKDDVVELRLRPQVAIRGLEVTIADLCDIAPTDAATLAVGQLRFGPAPTFGHTRTIVRSEIVQVIAAAGRDLSGFRFEGPREVIVQPVVTEISTQDLLDTATVTLQAALLVEGGDVEFEAPGRLRQMQAPPGRRSQQLRGRLRGEQTHGNQAIVDVEILVDGELYKQVPVQFRLTRFQPLLKTCGAIRAGTPLGPENVTIVREAVAQTNSFFLRSMEDVAGMVAARNLQSDQRLSLGDIAPPAVIRKGDVVTVVITQGRVKVTAKAMANHDAPMGGRLTLTNPHSRSQMVGLVTAPGLVVLQQ